MQTAAENDSNVKYQERFFNARDGIRLFYRRWFVPGGNGLVALVHGFAEHCGRYDELAETLNRAGWSVAAMDYRGHGQSGGRRAHIDDFEEYLQDVHAFMDEIRRDGFDDPPVLLGHSQGGLIAARFAELATERIAALILSSPFLGMAIKVPAPKVWMGKVFSRYLPTLAMPTGLDPAWVSHDAEIVDEYTSDPLVSHHATVRWFTEVSHAQAETILDAGKLRLPMIVMQAGSDRIASVDSARRLYDEAGSSDKRWEIYPDYYHEIFNEIGRERVFADLVAWLGQHS
jgi:lysophospholipase